MIPHTSRDTSSRESAARECGGTTRSRPTALAAMHHEVDVAVTRQLSHMKGPEETADTPQNSLKRVQL